MFQIHLWTGLGLGGYVLAISLSGSALVFRNDLYMAFTAEPVIVAPSGERLDSVTLRERAVRAHPGYEVSRVWENEDNPDQAIDITLARDDGRERHRLFDPYTGSDLGSSIPAGIRVMSWLDDLHVNLVSGATGRLVNAAAAGLWIVLGISGAFVWWPGIRDWRKSLGIRRNVSWRRFNWDLHSAAGIWMLLFVLLWGVTGVHVSIPDPFWAVVDYFEPQPDGFRAEPRIGEIVLRWSSRLHFGSFGGRPTQALWVVLGLAPVLLLVTGAIMWWNRVWRRRQTAAESGHYE
jgi:uncharacterized iron-regulated membrane protein